ncbi:restriction endonuclease subunit S [Gallibacterium anatis]|uniref:restriction endonuclease subunit S n=1 Tax=Gallibacterium anatis TaxID=750 RepID=UPI0039FC07AB
MSEWKIQKLSEVANIIGGGTPSSKENSYYDNGNIAWITPKDLSNYNEMYISRGERNITELGLKNSSAKLLPKGSVLFSSRAPIGYIAIARNELSTNQGFKSLVLKDGHIPEFYYYLLKNNVAIFEARASGSTFKEVSGQVVKDTELNIPDTETQKNIVNILKPLDDKIILNTQTNQTLEQIAQAIFKHWFIDFAPVHAKANALARGETIEQAERAAMACLSGKTVEKITALKTQDPTAYHQLQQTAAAFPSEFVETEMGQVPKGWEVLKFKDFVKETKEKVGKLQGIEEYSVGNEGIYPRKEKYKKQLAKDPSKNKLIREANIVFGMGNKEVNWGIMRDKIGSVSSAYNIFQINDINHLFLDMFINNIPYYFRDIIKPTSRQGQTIDKEAFLEKAIYYPNKEIINIFLEKITQINELSICIKSQNIYLLSIRDYLLPKLLDGEIRL